MATFISLINLTQQEITDLKDSPGRAAKFSSMAEKVGAKVKEIYWTIGRYDVVVVMEAPDDKTAAVVLLGLGSLGNVRTQTMRAFDSSEMEEIVSKAPD
jgi:uncharacterized protein with GYD domain